MAALGLVSATGPFSTDTYLAALPALRDSLGTTASAAQLTITTCIIGLAIGLFAGGTLSDVLGRRRLLLASTAAFLLLSLLAAFSPSIGLLIVCRLVQGAVAGMGASIARAVVSDCFAGGAAATRFGALSTISLLAPVIAPAIGGAMIEVTSWRGVFVLMAVLGAIQLLAIALGIPETSGRRPGAEAAPAEVLPLLPRVRRLFGERRFTGAVLVQCAATAGFFVYIGGSSFALQEHYGISAGLYSAVFASNAAGMALTSLLFSVLAARLRAETLRSVGVLASTSAAAVLLVLALLAGGDPGLVPVWACLFVMVSGMGLTQPATTTIAQEAGRWAPGTASSVQGGLAFLVGALATPLTGLVDGSSVVVMASLMTGLFVVAIGLMAAVRAGRG
jgi:DHA1 family bicyclomycin/chloramphenicol resistance-like MFS transporter